MNAANNSSTSYSNSFLRSIKPFLIGGISGIVATLVIYPLDTFKVQMQVVSQQYGINNQKQRVSILKVFKTIYKQKGVGVLYRGLESSLWRQLVYASARLGSYNYMVNSLKKKGRDVSFVEKSVISIFAGFIGALVGTPFDVVLVRRQASVTTGKRQYTSTYSAFKSILQEDGVRGLWTGLKITIVRVLLINFGQLAVHDRISQLIEPYFSKKMVLDNIAAILASCFTAVISLPADNIKVKLQKQGKRQIEYKGIYDCFVKTMRREGILRLWVGFPIYLVRGAPHSFILIRTQQYLTGLLSITTIIKIDTTVFFNSSPKMSKVNFKILISQGKPTNF